MQSVQAARPSVEPAFEQLRSDMGHPVLPIRFELLVQDRRLQGKGLSLVGGTCQGLLDPSLDKSRCLAMLQFSFEGFVLSVPAEVDLRVYDGSDQGEVSFAFADPAGAHLPQLRFVVNSFIAGDLVQIADVLQVNTHTHVANASRQVPRGPWFHARQSLRYGLVAALSLGFVAVAVATVQTRLLTRVEARPAVVSLSGTTLRAPASGQIDYLNPEARSGDVAFSLLSTTGAMLSIKMPCDCGVGGLAVAVGMTVLAGEQVMTLHGEDTVPEIRAVLSPEGLRAVLRGDAIELEFPDGTVLAAALGDGVAAELSATEPGKDVPVTLTPLSDLPPSLVGELAQVRIVKGFPFEMTFSRRGRAPSAG